MIKFTHAHLKELQSLPLERKVGITQARIIEWYSRWNGQVYVSFSGGKDSTVLLHIARSLFPDIEAVFVDTGLEYPEIRDFVKGFDNVTWLKPKMRFDEVIKKYGYPVIGKEVSQVIYEARNKPDGVQANRFIEGNKHTEKYGARFDYSRWVWLRDSDIPISHMCCNITKKLPAKRFEKKTGKKPIIGIMAAESVLRESEWLKNGCNAFANKRPRSNPMSFWTDQDVLQYLKLTKIPYCNVYGDLVPRSECAGQMAFACMDYPLMTTGCDRTGCMFCMFGVHLDPEPNRFQRMKVTHPKQYDYCIKPVDDGGLGLGQVLDFIKVKY